MFKFIHCADLHLGSPFSAWHAVRPETARRLADAPFETFDRLAAAAIAERAAFMLLAGDVFDSGNVSLYAEERFRDTLRKLDASGVRVFWARGNHDFAAAAGELPGNTAVFSAERAERFTVEVAGRVVAAVAGISHGVPDERRDLAPQVDALLDGAPGFRIALLHANVDGAPEHEPYAPAPLGELRRGHADYWALGHVHKRGILCREPYVVYSGSAQGRSVNEPGPRGGYLVEVDDAGKAHPVPLDLQTARFERLVLDDLGGAADSAALLLRFRSALPEIPAPLLLRVVLAGGTPLNSRLRAADREGLHELFARALRSELAEAELESVVVETSAPPSAARREGLAAQVAQVRSEFDPAAELSALPLTPGEFSGFSPAELAEIAREAEELLLDYLCGDLEAGK